MSAICGAVGLDGRRWDQAALSGVRQVLAPLGSDGGGAWSGDAGRCGVAIAVALHHRTPEDRADAQPTPSYGGNLVAVADIRLDNRDDLLAALGRTADKVPDSEILLAAYNRWGFACLDRFAGAFAFALVDRRRGGVLLARDHLGTRPLVVHQRSGLLAFASNAMALTAFEGVGRRLDEHKVAEVSFRIYRPERTLVAGVEWVPPGAAIWVSADGIRRWSWWRAPAADRNPSGPRAIWVDDLRDAFDQVVGGQLRLLGPVGVQMSGGLDSTSVAATAARLLAPDVVRSYTSVPPPGWTARVQAEPDDDETPLVRDLARRWPNLNPSFIDVAGSPLLGDHYESYWRLGGGVPGNPCNWLWMHAIRKAAAADGVRTLFTGVMGNSVFSADSGDWLGKLLRAGRLLTWLTEAAAWSRRPSGSWLRTLRTNVLPQMAPPALYRLRNWSRGRLGATALGLHLWPEDSPVRPHLAATIDWAGTYPELDGSHHITWDDLLRESIDEVAGQADTAASMEAAWGIDERDPTGDPRVWSAVLGLPEWARRHRGVDRAITREAMADRLPPSIVDRVGVGAQLPDWLDRMTDARAEVRAELRAAREHSLSYELLDLERLERLERAWPRPDQCTDLTIVRDYRIVLLRGLVMSRFLRWFEDSAREPNRPHPAATATSSL